MDEGEARVARSGVGDRFNTRLKSDAAMGGSLVGGLRQQVGPASASVPHLQVGGTAIYCPRE
jgi:hypothetical protein